MSLLKQVAIGLICTSGVLQAAGLKVAVVHPLLGDLAREIGGGQVEVVDLTSGAKDLHRFQPGPQELKKARGAQLYLVSGKGFEPYLAKLQSIVGKDRVLEVGRKIPSITYGKGANIHSCCPGHGGKSTIDPHWWQSMDAWRRAATIVADEFAKHDPAHKAVYAANAKRFRAEMDGLKSWAKGQLGRVPKKQRVLVTSHAAFGYFCKEFGWKMLPVQGLSREANTSPQHLGHVAEAIKKEGIPAVFPESNSNPKVLQTLVKQAGVKVGKPLVADGQGYTVKGMFQHNVTNIVAVMVPKK
jgi:zinc/manganese transport system substrate-binding protein